MAGNGQVAVRFEDVTKRYGNFTAVLLEAIKEQQARIDNLEAAVARLEAEGGGVER